MKKNLKSILIPIITLVIGSVIVFLITNYLNSSSINQIYVRGYYSSFNLPNNIIEDSHEFTWGDLKIEKDLPNIVTLDDSSASYTINNYIRKKEFIKNFEKLNEIESYWEYSINNTGNNEVKDLIIHFPSSGFYSIQVGTSELTKTFTDRISIGSIRSSTSISVKIWSDKITQNSFNTYSVKSETEDIKLTHPNGTVPIEYPLEATGLSKFLETNDLLFKILFSIIISLLLLLIFNTKTIKKLLDKKIF